MCCVLYGATSVIPEVNGRRKFKVVYVVLESQYQSSLTAACSRINDKQDQVKRQRRKEG